MGDFRSALFKAYKTHGRVDAGHLFFKTRAHGRFSDRLFAPTPGRLVGVRFVDASDDVIQISKERSVLPSKRSSAAKESTVIEVGPVHHASSSPGW